MTSGLKFFSHSSAPAVTLLIHSPMFLKCQRLLFEYIYFKQDKIQ